MRVAIIGIGNVGSAIARGLKDKEYTVTLGARDPLDARIAALATEVGATAALPADAAGEADVVILALPWDVAEGAVRQLGDLTGKTVVDCMNPLGKVDGTFGLLIGHTISGGEVVQGWLPGAHVVKSLNQVGAEIMAANDHMAHRPVMFMAGNDDTAKAQVAGLLTTLGFEALDAGDITRSRLLEPLGTVWINQALFRGKGRRWAFAALQAGR